VGKYEGDTSYLGRGLVGVRDGQKGLAGVSRSSAAAVGFQQRSGKRGEAGGFQEVQDKLARGLVGVKGGQRRGLGASSGGELSNGERRPLGREQGPISAFYRGAREGTMCWGGRATARTRPR
jgi:hypothetical protein